MIVISRFFESSAKQCGLLRSHVSFRFALCCASIVFMFFEFKNVKMQYSGFNRDRDRYMALRKKKDTSIYKQVK